MHNYHTLYVCFTIEQKNTTYFEHEIQKFHSSYPDSTSADIYDSDTEISVDSENENYEVSFTFYINYTYSNILSRLRSIVLLLDTYMSLPVQCIICDKLCSTYLSVLNTAHGTGTRYWINQITEKEKKGLIIHTLITTLPQHKNSGKFTVIIYNTVGSSYLRWLYNMVT